VSRRKTCAHFVNGPDKDGQSLMLRHGPGHVTLGTLTPCRDGKPMFPGAELVTVDEEPDGHLSCETLWSPNDGPSSGPAKVTTPAYRSGWDEIWGKPDPTLN